MDQQETPAAVSGPDSPAGSSPLFDDPGPAFNPEAAAAAPPPPAPDEPAPDSGGWDEDRVRMWLGVKGQALHGFLAVDPDSTEWIYTEQDLQMIAGPLARILNRYDATAALAEASDEASVAIGFGGYALRSYGERKAALRARRARQEQAPADVEVDQAFTAAGGEPDDERPPVPPLAGRAR